MMRIGKIRYQIGNATRSVKFILGTLSIALFCAAKTYAADTTKPSAPTNLAATVISATQINLTWTASTDNVGVTGYQIQRCTGSSCTSFAQVGTSTTTSFNNSGLTPSATFSYRVLAKDAAGNTSNASSTVTGKTMTDTSPPNPGPTNLVVAVVSTTQLNLSWTAAQDNVAVTGYRIERCTGATCSSFTQIGTSSTTTFNNTGLAANTTYRYRVRANDAASNLSSYSSIVNGTTQGGDTTPPDIGPTNLAVAVVSTTQLNLSWTAAHDNVGIAGYRIERCTGSPCTFAQIATTTTTSYNDISLAQGTTYSYRVRANDAAGNLSVYSSTAGATTASSPITYTYSYDNLGRVTQASGSDGKVINYTYDANGNVTTLNRQ